MARFKQVKSEEDPRLTQEQISRELGYSSFYQLKDIETILTWVRHIEVMDRKRSKLTSSKPRTDAQSPIDPKPQNNNTKSKRKSKNIQGGSLNAQSSIDAQSSIEIQPSIVNEEYLDNLINK